MNWNKPVLMFQRAYWNFNYWGAWSTEGLTTDRAANTNFHGTFNNQWSIHFGGTFAGFGDVYCNTCSRGGPAVRTDKGIYPWAGFVGDPRPPITPVMFVNYWKRDGGRSESFNISPEIDYRVGSQLRGAAVLSLTHTINDLQDVNPQVVVDTVTQVADTHYVFARIDQQTAALTFRLDYTATRTLTVQVYAQPFVSKGKWSNLRELSATPRAEAYDDRYQPYAGTMPQDFNSQFFNSNFVVRWEYRPGSTLYLVWNQGRQNFQNSMGDNTIAGDFGELFNTRPLNTFLIKLSYWFST
jgi:hypothetical protein